MKRTSTHLHAFAKPHSLKVRKTDHGGFSSQHSKTVIMDDEILYVGSCNMSHNGFDNNDEDSIRTTNATAVSDALGKFSDRWENSKEVTEVEVAKMMELHLQRQQKLKKNVNAQSVTLTSGAIANSPGSMVRSNTTLF